PGRDHAEVAALTVLLPEKARAARDRIVVRHPQRDESLVQAAVRVDLRDDFLADETTFRQAERALEARFLRIDVLVHVLVEHRVPGLDAQAVARDDSGRPPARIAEGAPELRGAFRPRVDERARRAGDGEARDPHLASAPRPAR